MGRLEGFFESVLEPIEGPNGVLSFCEHAEIELPASGFTSIWKTFLARYLGDDGKVDEKRVANDFATCAPIAARVEELKSERASNAARHK
jgi:hypothetical protein